VSGTGRPLLDEEPDPAAVRRLRSPLLRWYHRNKRDLPWRNTDDPYAIWVSEVMLQQTQVKTVLDFWRRFMTRFPTVESLANTPEEEVLAVWSGLGYYRRARSLHAGAHAVMERFGGRVPRDPAALLDLPGIGRYTAGAISSIAFGLAEPILDGNVRRVLSRLFALDAGSSGRGSEDRTLWNVAGTLVRGPDPGGLNQALMELGALVCVPRKPECALCPVRKKCAAFAGGDPEAFPTRRASRPTVTVDVAVAWIRRAGRVLIERPPASSPLRGTWDLPAFEIHEGEAIVPAIRSRMKQVRGLEVSVGTPVARLNHGIMHRRLRLLVHDCRHARGAVAGRDDLRWLDPRDLDGVAISGATRKVADALSVSSSSDSRSNKRRSMSGTAPNVRSRPAQ